ncbi:MAG TPA: hypothetical protein VK498_07675 [Ferruginibacter sp.]|nr:hypothetical protein [Ferruginibacter sp.]
MQFYRIRHSIDNNIIGPKYPQVEKVLIPSTWNSPDFIESFINKEAPADVDLPTPILYKNSNLTDLLSASTVGLSLSLLVSDRFKIIIQEKIKGIQLFPVKVIHCENEYPYWILHPFSFSFDLLNIQQSTMGYYSDFSMKNLDQRFIPKNWIDLKKEIELFDKRINDNEYDGKIFGITKIVFEEEKSVDFFSLRCISGGTGFFVSEKLKDEIESALCTGIVFTEPNEQHP